MPYEGAEQCRKKLQGEDHLQELDAGKENRSIMKGRSDLETLAVEAKIDEISESKIWGIKRQFKTTLNFKPKHLALIKMYIVIRKVILMLGTS